MKFDEQIKNFWFDETRAGTISFEEKPEEFKNRFAYGAFLDMELKQVLFKRLSVFSRVEVDDVTLTNTFIRGIPFLKWDYTYLEFMLGIRFNERLNQQPIKNFKFFQQEQYLPCYAIAMPGKSKTVTQFKHRISSQIISKITLPVHIIAIFFIKHVLYLQ